MQAPRMDPPRIMRMVRWTAGISGGLYAGLVLLFVAVYLIHPTGEQATASELLALALYPAGTCVALLAALRWPWGGGLASLACLAGFCVWLTAARGDRGVPGLILFAFLPAVLHVLHGAAARRSAAARSAARVADRLPDRPTVA